MESSGHMQLFPQILYPSYIQLFWCGIRSCVKGNICMGKVCKSVSQYSVPVIWGETRKKTLLHISTDSLYSTLRADCPDMCWENNWTSQAACCVYQTLAAAPTTLLTDWRLSWSVLPWQSPICHHGFGRFYAIITFLVWALVSILEGHGRSELCYRCLALRTVPWTVKLYLYSFI